MINYNLIDTDEEFMLRMIEETHEEYLNSLDEEDFLQLEEEAYNQEQEALEGFEDLPW